MQLILDTKDLKLLKKRGSFLVESPKGGSRTISPKKLSSIAITQKVLLSSDAVTLAIQHEIPILFFDRIGKAKARLWSPYFGSIATLRRQQVKFSESPDATRWMIRLFGHKTDAQIQNLNYIKNRAPSFGQEIEASIQKMEQQRKAFQRHENQLISKASRSMMGIEGNIAKIYWQQVGAALPVAYSFKKRSRRPARDSFNAALNYLYGMLYSVVEGALFAAGLDPHLGILHADEYNKPVLAFDLIEAFRPWIDRILLEECFIHNLESQYFTKNQHGLFFNKVGKAYIIPLFNDYLRSPKRYFERESSVKNQIYYLAGQLAKRVRTFETDMRHDVEGEE